MVLGGVYIALVKVSFFSLYPVLINKIFIPFSSSIFMKISFFEEFMDNNIMKKLNLIDFPTKEIFYIDFSV